MKNLIVLLVLLSTVSIEAGLKSPFPSSVEGFNTPNAHFVDVDERIIRSQAPIDLNELIDLDVAEVIIFKSQTRTEVDKEITKLKELGYKDSQIHHIPFKWRGFTSYKNACQQTIKALRVLKRVKETTNARALFHCTVGEDRTGYLAGLYRMMTQNWSHKKAFQIEMCENGYSRGNPNKPYIVTKSIQEDLSPLFFYMASKVYSGELNMETLDESVCEMPEQLTPTYSTCEASSKFPN